MPYTVSSSERTRSSGAEYETKALLYLMNFRDDSDEIHYFVVDFFNDLTGMDRFADNLWDVQSKGAKNNSPAAIGKELVTLFKNFLSDLDFKYLILFLGGVSSTVRIDDKMDVFSISNITSPALIKLKEGLKSEAEKKTYIENSKITDNNIDSFLEKVLFVIDNKAPEEYVRAIIKDHPAIIPEGQILRAIFNEIRNAQSELKNTSVEGVVIQTSDEVLSFCRHLTNNEIRLMTLNRIINRNPVEKNSVPPSFIPIYNSWVPEKRRDMLDQCVQTLCKALFNKNAASEFWGLFENIYSVIVEKPAYDVQSIYQAIDVDKRNASPDFDAVSLKYFISVVKDGIQNEN
ncbi:MAG: hypothetical protein IKO51_02665 [Clostridia bacterium]|nr:hypothetical protein [Clostridia bacterium]